jgi:hypothetical protein
MEGRIVDIALWDEDKLIEKRGDSFYISNIE